MNLAGWRLVSELGRGASSRVWRAARGDLSAAVKLIPRAHTSGRDHLAAEVRILARLEHPAILAIYDHGVTTEPFGDLPAATTWIATELADATLQSRRPKGWTELSDVLSTLLDALAHSHARGVIHRDLKPSNVLWVGASPRLGDFGIARARGGGGGAPSGSPVWMAPEQAAGRWQAEGPWTDLYALGVTAWELISGESPYSGHTAELLAAHRDAPVPPLRPRFAIPAGAQAWVAWLMEKLPHDRPQLAADALDALLAMDGDRRPRTWTRPARVRHAGPGLLPIRRPEPVGRDTELAALGALLERLSVGEPRMALARIRGPSGIGTSTLAGTIHRRAEESGVATGIALPSPPGEESRAAAAAFAAAFGAVGLRGPALRAQLDRLEAGPAAERLAEWLTSPAASLPELRARIALGLQVLSRRRPVILRFRDIETSAAALQLVAGWAERRPKIRALILLCGDDAAIVPAGRASWERTGAAADLDLVLGPVDASVWEALVDAWLPLDPTDRRLLAQAAGGDPRMVAQVLAARRSELVLGPRGWRFASPIPPTLAAAWAERLAQLDPSDRHALSVAGVLGSRVEREEWLDATALDEWEVDDVEERLLATGLVVTTRVGLAFPTSTARDQVMTTAAAADAAAALDRRGANAGRRARLHGRAGHLSEAIALASDAVEDAIALDAPAEAEALLDLWTAWCDALGRPPDHPERERVAAAWVRVDYLVGRFGSARARAERLRTATDPVARGVALLYLGILAANQGVGSEALLEEAEASFASAGVTGLAIDAALAAAFCALQAGEPAESRRRLDALAPHLAALGESAADQRTRERAIHLDIELRSAGGDHATALELLTHSNRPVARLALARGILLGRLGRIEEAEQALAEAVDEAELAGLASEAMARVNLGAVLVRLGRPLEGIEHLDRALPELAERPRLHGMAQLFRAEASLAAGDRRGAEAAIAAALAMPWRPAADGNDRGALLRLAAATPLAPLTGLQTLSERLGVARIYES